MMSTMSFPIRTLTLSEFPPLLHQIPDPPKTLSLRGSLPTPDTKLLAVVGSRKYTSYGEDVCEQLLAGLRGYPICIISGLALGIDAIAHRAALTNQLMTVAVPGSGLADSVLYPRSHLSLAYDILDDGGGLLSEFDPQFESVHWAFPQRNRIMAGMSHATLVIEAAEKSGTLITSRLATEYNRDVLTVPGSIFSKNSAGPHMLLTLGATPIMSSSDLIEALNVQPDGVRETPVAAVEHFSPSEQSVIAALSSPLDREELYKRLTVSVSELNVILTKLELRGIIADSGGVVRRA